MPHNPVAIEQESTHPGPSKTGQTLALGGSLKLVTKVLDDLCFENIFFHRNFLVDGYMCTRFSNYSLHFHTEHQTITSNHFVLFFCLGETDLFN